MTRITNNKMRGFTIVELLVVVIVIGVLAAITAVSYANVTSRAKTSAGQSAATNIMKKVGTYTADGSTGNWPTTWSSLNGVGVSSTNTYFMTATDPTFTTLSSTATTPAIAAMPANPETIDYYLCGTNTTAAATTYGTVNVPTGVKLQWWDYTTGAITASPILIGTTSGTHTNGYNVTCYKVGIADAVAGFIKASYNETGAYPTTAAAASALTPAGASKPTGVTISTAAPAAGTATTQVRFDCGVATNGAGPCLTTTSGRIAYWDTSGTPQIRFVYIGSNTTNFWTPAS